MKIIILPTAKKDLKKLPEAIIKVIYISKLLCTGSAFIVFGQMIYKCSNELIVVMIKLENFYE